MKSDQSTVTVKNLEAALAGESMAHIKYRYFAQLCRQQGDETTAILFEETAAQEVQHALGHMGLLFPINKLTPEKCLQMAIEGETYEYTEMYPKFKHLAEQEGNQAAADEFNQQIEESADHAQMFQQFLKLAAKRFAALAKVEEKHANQYRKALENQ